MSYFSLNLRAYSTPLSCGLCTAEDDIGDVVIGKVLYLEAVVVKPDPDIGDELLEPVGFGRSVSCLIDPLFLRLCKKVGIAFIVLDKSNYA